MAETAVGLFANASSAEKVVSDLKQHGFPADGIRVVSHATGANAALLQDLRSMGATDWESEAYQSSLSRGNSLVFATGTNQEAATAIAIMNDHNALDVEEFATPVTTLHGEEQAAEEADTVSLGSKSTREQSKSEGARVFTW